MRPADRSPGPRHRPSSAAVRRQVGHPIVDIDGHLVEHLPEVLPFVREHLSAPLFDRFAKGELAPLLAPDPRPAAERAPSRTPQSGWWGLPTRATRDRATAMLPGLLHERMDELGLDLAVLYPTLGFGIAGLADDELRRGLCAGWNAYLADVVAPYRDRLRVAGIVPMHTPGEAIAELERCVARGIDVVGLPHGVVRPIAAPRLEAAACLWPGLTHWLDTYGLDSEHDYDPVWARCRQLRLPVTFHGGLALDARHTQSVSSFVWNHLGLHASMMDQVCRSLVLGGVTHRFPDVPFAFLEGGVGWAAIAGGRAGRALGAALAGRAGGHRPGRPRRRRARRRVRPLRTVDRRAGSAALARRPAAGRARRVAPHRRRRRGRRPRPAGALVLVRLRGR